MSTMTPPTSYLRLVLFKDSRKAFLTLLDEHQVQYNEMRFKANVPMASGFMTEILTGSGVWATALASVIHAYLKNRRSRKCIIMTKDNEIIYCEGMSQKGIERCLKDAKNLTAIETQRDET